MTEQEIADYCLVIKRHLALNTHEDIIIRSMRLNNIPLKPFSHLFKTDILALLEAEREKAEFLTIGKDNYETV